MCGTVVRVLVGLVVVAQQLTDLPADLATAGSREEAFPLPHGRGDQVRHGCHLPVLIWPLSR